MIWLAIAVLAALALAPVGWAVLRVHEGRLRGRQDAALALHRAQLVELDRDLADGRLMQAEHAGARLEVQRRLLADAALQERGTRRSGPLPVVIVALAIPVVAIIFYAANGHPDYAAVEVAARRAQQAASDPAQEAAMIDQLRGMLAKMDPHSDRARKGYLILGRSELTRGHLPEAAEAWRQALAAKYEPELAAETAEVMTEAEGHISPEAAALFRRALADAPAGAPWRKMAEKRAAEAGGS